MSKLKLKEVNKMENNKDNYEKSMTIRPRLEMKFSFVEEETKEESGFTFQNNLLNKTAYKFIKQKDECLAKLDLDDTLPNNHQS